MNKLDFYFNKFPLVLIYILIFFLNFHQIISKYLFFYKEFFSLIFLTLSIIYFFYFKLKFFDLVFKSKLHIFLFPYLILILIFIFNIGNVDPEFTKSSTILKDDTEKYFLLLYTIRNFTILIPVVLFFSLRGIREYEINKLLLFLIFVGFMGLVTHQIYAIDSANVSMYHFYYNNNHYSEYNTHIPFISSLYAISLYLVFKEKNNFYFIFLIFINASFLFIIFFSSSKAAILFSLISFVYFLIIFIKIKKLPFFLIGKLMTLFLFYYAVNIYHNHYKITLSSQNDDNKYVIEYYQMDKNKFTFPLSNKKFKRLNLDSRLVIYQSFLKYYKETTLSDKNFYFGMGSLSSMFSGFHNDYMRIFYRAGIIGLISAFSPFIYFFFKFTILSYKKYFFKNKKNIKEFVYLITVLFGFTLYYSLFAYPREDIYQSSTIWLSLILTYGYLNDKNILNKKIN